MASDLEDDEDLASLRNAALASLNVRSAQASPLTVSNVQEDSKQEEDDDDDLEALRLAALKTKKAIVPQPVTPQPRGPTQVPFSETSSNTVRGNNLISIPLVDLSTQDTSSKEPVVPEVKKEVRNDKFSRFQSDSESEEESDQEEQEEGIKNIEENDNMSSAEETNESNKSGDESVEESSKEEDSESSESSESDSEKSNETDDSSSSSESEESSSDEDETIKEPSITKETTADKQNGLEQVKSDSVKEFEHSVTDKTVDLRNQLRKKHLERRNNHIERENRYKTHRVTNEATSRGYSRSYDDQKRTSKNEPDKYDSNRDRKSNNLGRIHERRHYERPRKTDMKSRGDDNCKDNKKERDRNNIVSSSERNRVLDRRKAEKTKENSQSDTLKNEEKNKIKSDSLSDSEESDDDTDSRFKQLKNDRSVDQNISAPSRIVSSMQLNQKFEPNFGRSRELHRDRRKDLQVRYASRFDNRDHNRWNDSHRKDQYYRDDKTRDNNNDQWKKRTVSSHERSRGKDVAKSRELEFVDDYSDDEQHKKSIRSFVHTKETKKSTKQNESKDKKHKREEHKKDFENEKRKHSSKERTDYDRSKENRARKSKSESSIKLLKRVKQLDVDDESKTTEVSVTFDSDPDKVLKRSKKSIQERLGKTVSKHKASVKLRLGSKDNAPSSTWDSTESISMESGDNNLRKFVSKDSGKSRKSVKERLNLKRTPDEIGIDSSVEPSRKIVRTSKSTGALDKMNEEEKLKRKQKEKEIQEKIRKIEERNLAASKEMVKNTKVDIPDNPKNKDKELELRIQRIQEKNEAILKRQREIEEDKQKYGK